MGEQEHGASTLHDRLPHDGRSHALHCKERGPHRLSWTKAPRDLLKQLCSFARYRGAEDSRDNEAAGLWRCRERTMVEVTRCYTRHGFGQACYGIDLANARVYHYPCGLESENAPDAQRMREIIKSMCFAAWSHVLLFRSPKYG